MTTTTKATAQLVIEGDTERLLTHLWRGGAHGFYWTSSGRRSLWVDPAKLHHIPTGWAEQNVYFGVHPCREIPPTNSKGETTAKAFVRSQVDYLAALNCIFAEYDAKAWRGGKAAILAHLATFPQDKGWPYPSAIVDSGGGYHCYWLLEKTVTITDDNREHLKRLQAAWVQLVGADPDAKDLARVLRIPGTLNVKPDYGPDFPQVSFKEANWGRLYRLEDFETLTEHLRADPAPTATPQAAHRGYSFTDDLTKAAENLKRLHPGRADNYQEWVNVGMALSALGDAGLPLWEDWSQQSGKYQPGVCAAKWKGFTPGGGLGLGSLSHWADEDDPSGKRIYTNGNGPGAGFDLEGAGNPSAEDIGLAGDGETSKGNTQGGLLDELLKDLAAIDDDKPDAKKLFALENMRGLVMLDDEHLAVFRNALHGQGVGSDWVKGALLPAIEQEKQRQADEAARERGDWLAIVGVAQRLGYSFRLNDLSDSMEVKTRDSWERMTDVHEATLLSLLHAKGFKRAEVARRAFLAAAGQERYHPVKAYLEGLEWDGQDRIAALAGYFRDAHDPITYADGTQRTVFHALLRRWLVGAVGKVHNPTVSQNPMLILAGGQGKGKSYFAKWICPLEGMHFEGAIKPEDKDYLGYLTSKWVWEVSELGATMRKADREALKAFITQQEATFRPAFGRYALVKPAMASFVGTVNPEGALLADPTGNRRFRIVELVKEGESIDWAYAKDIDLTQLWAQAKALYEAGEPWRLATEENSIHEQIIELYEVEDILAGYVQEYFRIEPGNDALFTHTTSIISTLRDPNGADVKGSERGLSMQLSSTLARLGLVKAKRENRWGYLGIARRLD